MKVGMGMNVGHLGKGLVYLQAERLALLSDSELRKLRRRLEKAGRLHPQAQAGVPRSKR